MKLITKKLCSDPYINEIPLSYINYNNNSFTGYFKYNNELAALARVYTTYKSTKVELADIYIMEKLRGRMGPNNMKWSNILMSAILKAIKRRKFKKIWLWTTRNNIKAIKLYKKFNFKHEKFPINKKKRFIFHING